jgi:hypothetical protein
MEKRSLAAKKQSLRDGLNLCLAKGLTAVQTNDEQCVEAYIELQRDQEALLGGGGVGDEEGESLPIRVFLTPNHTELSEEGAHNCVTCYLQCSPLYCVLCR